jgi:hypothetical protein
MSDTNDKGFAVLVSGGRSARGFSLGATREWAVREAVADAVNSDNRGGVVEWRYEIHNLEDCVHIEHDGVKFTGKDELLKPVDTLVSTHTFEGIAHTSSAYSRRLIWRALNALNNGECKASETNA